MISFDTTPQSSTAELVDYLAHVAQEMSLVVEVFNESQHGQSQKNIIIRHHNPTVGEKNFILQSHLDTVDPGAFGLWKKNNLNPFSATIEDEAIYGLGAANVKLDFLCKLFSLYQTKNNEYAALKPILIGTYGEETGMQGTLKLIRKNKINARYALVSEPSNLQIINATKGFLTVEIRIPFSKEESKIRKKLNSSESVSTVSKVFSGKSAHSSTPHLGENAAIKLFEYIKDLPDETVLLDIDAGGRFNLIPHQASVEIDQNIKIENSAIKKIKQVFSLIKKIEEDMKNIQDLDFFPSHSTVSIGIVRMYEDYILVGGSCRIVPSVAQDIYEKWVQIFEESCLNIGVEFHIQDFKKAFRTDVDSLLIRTLQSELAKKERTTACRSVPSTNEASLLTRVGVETVCMGVGEREGNAHTPSENVKLSQIDEAIDLYTKIIDRLCR